MTRVILHGGYGGLWDNAGKDMALFQILADAAAQADNRLLISFLAHEKPSDFPHLDQLLATFRIINPDVQVTIAGQDNFRELLPQFKVLFLQGGTSRRQHQALKGYSKEDLMENKTLIARSSSGSMMLCKYGYSRSSNGVLEGKGVVDYAVMPHANAWAVEEFLSELQAVTTCEILLLDEMQIIELKTA